MLCNSLLHMLYSIREEKEYCKFSFVTVAPGNKEKRLAMVFLVPMYVNAVYLQYLYFLFVLMFSCLQTFKAQQLHEQSQKLPANNCESTFCFGDYRSSTDAGDNSHFVIQLGTLSSFVLRYQKNSPERLSNVDLEDRARNTRIMN